MMNTEIYRDKVRACWMGKCLGGNLGMPYEGCEGPLELKRDDVQRISVPNDDLELQMNRLRRVQGAAAAREALGDLKRFVAGKNQKALASVEEVGEELIALHLLEAPSTLQVSLLSTNAVEDPIRNFRTKTRRVTRWRPQSDMSERWTAYAMLTVEQGFRRIYGYHDLPVLLRALGWREENMARVTGTITPDQNRGDGTPQKDH